MLTMRTCETPTRTGSVNGVRLMASAPRDILTVWKQDRIPVVYLKPRVGLCVRLPYAPDNMEWLRESGRKKPDWIAKGKWWEVPKSWFNDLVRRALLRHGSVYVIQEYREKKVCAPACMNAQGFDCDCSCMGEFHGSESEQGWYVVSETFAVRHEARDLACRLIKRSQAQR